MPELRQASNCPWSDGRVDRLVELHRSGATYPVIAAELGITRNAVIGKAHRLRLPKRAVDLTRVGRPHVTRERKRPEPEPEPKLRLRPKIESLYKPPRSGAKRKKLAPTAPVLPVAAEPEKSEHCCTIAGLTDATCRWPLWATDVPYSELLYCGTPDACLSANVPYCEKHRAVALANYNKP